MNHDEAALLDAVIATPDDDAVRLVYADWLEDHGRPARAEFIRVQVELARLPARDARRGPLAARERELLRVYERTWVGPLQPWVRQWEFRRGFVDAVALKAETLLKHAACLFRVAPIRRVELHRAGKRGCALAACRHLAGLTSLRVHHLYAADTMALLASPHLGGLTALDVQGTVGDEAVVALAASPLLGQLAELALVGSDVRDAGVQALAASRHVSRLERLNLSRNRITEVGAAALAESSALPRLRSLSLSGHWVRERGKRLLRARFGDRVEFD